MPKVKLTKGELKKQRDALRQYERYLPTLQLKKQQLQMEIIHQSALYQEKQHSAQLKESAIKAWAGLLTEAISIIRSWLSSRKVITGAKNIAGVDVPVFQRLEFGPVGYDLFLTPLWVDHGLEVLRTLACLREEVVVIDAGIRILKQELRITTQRVNLFEKVKIPQAEEAIRLIKIYIGDQMANAVGRSKIAKKKIEEYVPEEVAV